MDEQRRAILRGTAITALAAAGAAPSDARPDTTAALLREGRTSGSIATAPDRATLTARRDPAVGDIIFLAEGARDGLFKCVAGGAPAKDPHQGIHVPSVAGHLHYQRIWDGSHGRPEWFGAVPNDSSQDCADAIEACYALCPVTELAAADYHIRRTLHFCIDHRTVRGVGNGASGQGQGTRLVLQGAAPGIHTDDIVVVGSVEKPGGDGLSENHFSNFVLLRDGASTPHPSGDIARYPAGLRASFLFHCSFRHITSLESSVGFSIGGVVYTAFDDCCVTRARAGTSPKNDYNVGYFLNGQISFGYPGGNASLYLNRCLAADQHPSHVDAVGLLARGAFVDTFIDQFESARIASGLVFAVDGARGYSQTINVHLRNAVLDGISKVGIDLDLDATASASIEIIDPYIAAAGAGGERGIAVHDGAGLVTITGGQIHGTFDAGSIHVSRSWGVKVQGTKLHQALKPVVVDDAGGLHLEPQINSYQKMSPHFAIDCRTLSRSSIRPILIGATPAFKGGISLDPTSHHNAIDGSAIHPDCLVAPDARTKVWFNGGDARNGANGTAFAAAGNRLLGVTD